MRCHCEQTDKPQRQNVRIPSKRERCPLVRISRIFPLLVFSMPCHQSNDRNVCYVRRKQQGNNAKAKQKKTRETQSKSRGLMEDVRKNMAKCFWCSSMCACSTRGTAYQLKHFILLMRNENSFYASPLYQASLVRVMPTWRTVSNVRNIVQALYHSCSLPAFSHCYSTWRIVVVRAYLKTYWNRTVACFALEYVSASVEDSFFILVFAFLPLKNKWKEKATFRN